MNRRIINRFQGLAAAIGLLFATTALCQPPAEIELAGQRFEVELATTPAARERGLMFRTFLPANKGMLFLYKRPQPVSYWNKNVPIYLDYLFFDNNRRLVHVESEVPPCLADDCPEYPVDGPIQYVLELAGGTAERLKIESGVRFEFWPIQ